MNKKLCLSIVILASFTFTYLASNSKSHAADNTQIEFAADHPPYLEDFVMNTDKDKINLSIKVANPFDHEIKSLLLNGVSQKITLYIVTKVNKFNLFLVKFNREIGSDIYTHSINYNNLKKLFTVSRSIKTKPIETTSYKEAIQLASEFKEITLLQGNQLKKRGIRGGKGGVLF